MTPNSYPFTETTLMHNHAYVLFWMSLRKSSDQFKYKNVIRVFVSVTFISNYQLSMEVSKKGLSNLNNMLKFILI